MYMMSRKLSRRVAFSPDYINDKSIVFHKHGSGNKVGGNKVIGIWNSRVPESSGFSPARFLRRIGSEVARALRSVSTRKRSSGRVSSSSSSSLARSRSYAEPLDSHRAEAMEDCIEFLNSSSSSSYSLQRSNSVSTFSC